MSRNKEAYERRRRNLWREQEGKCYWCKCNMMHWNDFRNDPGKVEQYGLKRCKDGSEKFKSMPLTLATLDHLRDKFHPERQIKPVNQEQRWVLACWKCNNERGKASEKQQPIEVLQERSKRVILNEQHG